MLTQLRSYEPPKWASSLKDIPQFFVQLAQRNTPIHPWNISNLPEGFSLSIKRDDLTGSTLSGNKVRKLEFLLADALNKKCDTIFTCGGVQSNHCRATAVAARQLGLDCYLFLRSSEQKATGILSIFDRDRWFILHRDVWLLDCISRDDRTECVGRL